MEWHLGRFWANLPGSIRFVILTLGVIGIWSFMLQSALTNEPVFGQVRGGTADWLVATEASRSGGDAYRPVSELASDHLGWESAQPESAHPRPPSAILLLLPLSLVPPDQVIRALMVVSAAGLVLWTQAAVAWLRAGRGREVLVIPFAVTLPQLQGVVWGSHVPVMAAILGLYLTGLSRNASTSIGGVSIGVAGSLKVFPLMIAVVPRQRRVRQITFAALTIACLTAAGLALPGVGLSESLAAMLDAPRAFADSQINMSIAFHLGGSPVVAIGVAIAVLLLALWMGAHRVEIAVLATLVLMILASPLAWPEYLVLVLPVLLALSISGQRPMALAAAAWAVMMLTTDGTVLLMVCVALLLALQLPEVRKHMQSLAAPSGAS